MKKTQLWMVRKRRFLFTLTLLLVLAWPAFPQAQTGAITGRIQDTSTALMPGVDVSISSPSMIGGARNALTDEQGTYRFTLLPAGSYRVTFALPGFKTLNVDDVSVNVGATMTINGTLEVAAQGEEISVTSNMPTIDLEDPTVGVNWSLQKFDNLPYGRYIRGMVQMVPGLYATSYDVGGNTKGGSTGAGTRTYGRLGGDAMLIDGALFGGAFGEFGSYGEAQVVTAAKGAEAMSPGTAFSFVIKSGGNDFHGSLYTEYEDGKFQSNNVTKQLLARGFNPSGNKFTHSNDLTAEIGGPIVRDKLWFYYSYGDTYVGQFVPGFVSTKTGQPAVYYIALHSPTLKLTAQLTPKMKLELSMHSTYKYQPYRAGNQFTPLEASEKETYWGGASLPTLSWTYIINSKMTANVAFHRSGYYYRSDGWTSDPRQTDLITTQTRGAFQTIHRYPRRWQWDGMWSWFTGIGGKNNEIKSGYTYILDKNSVVNVGYPNQELYRYRSLPGETDYFQHPDSVLVYDYPNTVTSRVNYSSWFLNDKITLSRKLTVNAGIRFDRYASWLPEQGNPGTGPFSTQRVLPERHDFPVYNSWLPRFSFVYDVSGTGRLALKASYGRYVGGGSSLGSGPLASLVNPNEVTVRTYSNWDGSIPYIPRAENLASVTGGGGNRQLDPNLKPTYMDEITGGIELGLSRDYLVRFNAVRKVDRAKSKTLDLAMPYSAYTDVRFGVDPGRDNISGTADDGVIQAWSVPRSYPTFGQVNQFITNTADGEGVDLYTAYETSFSKQYSKGWSLLVGYTADFAKRRNAAPQNPNDLVYNWQLPVWSQTVKINGQRNLPWGMMYSSTYQAQSGEWFGRFAQVRNALNALVTVQVEGQVGRYEWVKLWDNRISKTFKISERQSIEAMFNLYNTLNSSAVLTQVNTNGPDYLKPLVGASNAGGSSAGVESAIVPPRIFSLGARWRF